MSMAPQEVVERALALRTTAATIVVASSDARADLRWARSTLTTNGLASAMTITVIAFHDTGSGRSTATVARPVTTPESIEDAVRAAEAAARAGGPAEDESDLATAGPAASDWEEPARDLDSGALAPVAAALGAVLASQPDIEHFGYAEQSLSSVWIGSSTGLRVRYDQPQGRLELTAKSHGRTRSSWAGVGAPDLAADVASGRIDVASLAADLSRSLAWQARQVDVDPGRHPAILTPSAVGDLMVDLWWSATARDAAEGRSVFSRAGGGTRIGDVLSTRPLDLFGDPAAPALECAPVNVVGMSSPSESVFDNGLGLGRTDWLREGRLAGLASSRAVAREFDLPLTLRPDNLIMSDRSPGAEASTVEDVIARTDHGLLVTCLWYIRVVDPQTLLLTGLTRDGVYLVEHGEVVGSVGNFRFNESPVGLLSRVVDSGATRRTLPREMADYVNRVAMPPLVVDDFNFSTRSDAL